MNNIVNSVINNLVGNASPVFQEVVKETAGVGFMYTMIGCVLFGIGCLLAGLLAWKWKKIEENGAIVGSVASGLCVVIGFAISIAHISEWFGPTKAVVWKLLGS